MVVVRTIPVELPPEARKPSPPLVPRPTSLRDLSDLETFAGWASDRTARNVCEARRVAAVAAVDAAGGPR